LGAFKSAAESCDKALQTAGENKRLQAQAWNLKGVAYTQLADDKNDKRLREAEAAFRRALELAELRIAHYNLGVALLKQERDPEGIRALREYLELDPDGRRAEEARRQIEDPRRAREAFAPDFSLVTLGGEYVSLEELKGKVVLLDFWATWCKPCVASVGELRNLHKRMRDKPFVMIGVSVDTDEEKWKAFVGKQEMAWPQFFDRERKVARAFGVNAFPTYIVIDHDGIIRHKTIGSGWPNAAVVEGAIKQALKKVTKEEPRAEAR
jgi:peroxiredoxin